MESLAAEPVVFLTVDEESAGVRLDRFLADRIRECSRTFLQRMIREGNVSLDGGPAKAGTAVRAGSKISVSIVEDGTAVLAPEPEDIPLDVIWEDADLLVVNKPPGMATHPSFGHTTGTLVNALLFRGRQLSDVGGAIRPGIVHRLDMDTSGLLVVARNDRAHRLLQDQFRRRETRKEYRAIVHGTPNPRSGSISAPLARSRRDRKRMSTAREGKAADTEYVTIDRFRHFSLVALKPLTGRTHQLRVHLASRGNPVLCDGLYGREVDADRGYLLTRKREPGAEPVISRQALHAMRLSFTHPSTGLTVGFEAPIPEDMRRALDVLAAGASPPVSGAPSTAGR